MAANIRTYICHTVYPELFYISLSDLLHSCLSPQTPIRLFFLISEKDPESTCIFLPTHFSPGMRRIWTGWKQGSNRSLLLGSKLTHFKLWASENVLWLQTGKGEATKGLCAKVSVNLEETLMLKKMRRRVANQWSGEYSALHMFHVIYCLNKWWDFKERVQRWLRGMSWGSLRINMNIFLNVRKSLIQNTVKTQENSCLMLLNRFCTLLGNKTDRQPVQLSRIWLKKKSIDLFFTRIALKQSDRNSASVPSKVVVLQFLFL